MRFRIAAVLEALEMDLLSPVALERATDLAMEYFDKLYKVARPAGHASSELSAIAARETEIREQFKAGKLPPAVFRTWLDELAKERRALSRPAPVPAARVSRSQFLQAYKAAVARRLSVFTKRDNVASARLALCNVLVDGRLALRPDAKNARFEGTLTLSHEQFLAEKQVDIKMVAGAG